MNLLNAEKNNSSQKAKRREKDEIIGKYRRKQANEQGESLKYGKYFAPKGESERKRMKAFGCQENCFIQQREKDEKSMNPCVELVEAFVKKSRTWQRCMKYPMSIDANKLSCEL